MTATWLTSSKKYNAGAPWGTTVPGDAGTAVMNDTGGALTPTSAPWSAVSVVAAYLDSMDATVDQHVYVEVVLGIGTTQNISISLYSPDLQTNNWGRAPHTGYCLLIDSRYANEIDFGLKVAGGDLENLWVNPVPDYYCPFVFPDNNRIAVRLQLLMSATPPNYSAKIWPAGDAEPAAWTFTADINLTDPQFLPPTTPGKLLFIVSNGDSSPSTPVTFFNLSVTAPTPPTGFLTPDPEHPGLYLFGGAGFTLDPNHPGLYSTGGLVEDPDHPGYYLIGDPTAVVSLIPDSALGSTTVSVDFSATSFRFVDLVPDLVFSQTDAQLDMDLAYQFDLDPVVGRTDVNIAADLPFTVDPVRSVTVVTIDLLAVGVTTVIPQLVAGFTYVRLVTGYDPAAGIDPAVRNTPILLAFTASGQLEQSEPLVSI